jgi:hypothetical protein
MKNGLGEEGCKWMDRKTLSPHYTFTSNTAYKEHTKTLHYGHKDNQSRVNLFLNVLSI